MHNIALNRNVAIWRFMYFQPSVGRARLALRSGAEQRLAFLRGESITVCCEL
jgi:hypothetical protein